MKIAHVAPPWLAIPPKNYGGTESVIADLVEEQVAQGHDVTLFATEGTRTSARLISFLPKPLRDEGVPWGTHLSAFYHLYNALTYKGDFEIVHTHLSSSGDLYILPLTATMSTPHVTTLHSRFPFDHVQNWVGEADNRYISSWGSAVPMVAISESARADAPAGLHIIAVVYNGIALKEYVPAKKPRGEYLAWLGRFSPEKGPHLAIEAAKKVQKQLILAGTIDRGQKDSINYFHDMIEPHIDNEQIRYIGPVNKKQKVNLLSMASGFLNPIQWEEPFGMVMIEAMAVGCPVISFARGAAPELIIDGKTGFLVKNIDEMVQAIPRLAELDRQAARQHVEEHFSSHAMAEGYMNVYQSLVLSPPQGSPREAPKPKAMESTSPRINDEGLSFILN